MVDSKTQRIALFNALEPGSHFWCNEISEFGISAVYEAIINEIYDPEKFEKIITRVRDFKVHEWHERLEETDAVFLDPDCDAWPDSLNHLANPPIGLIVKGNVKSLKAPSLAIVGTRNPTPYGIRIAGDFAAGFVDREWAIVSGGAYGIDAAAHRGALVAEGCTIAVIASGIDSPYPSGNAKLFSEIVENGAIVSEVSMGIPALPHRFLTRNRLIAALSKSTLVVEAAFRSGSLRTARDAAELMKPVMAIPGPINSPSSEGCHRLIGERSAELVTSVADAYELLSVINETIPM